MKNLAPVLPRTTDPARFGPHCMADPSTGHFPCLCHVEKSVRGTSDSLDPGVHLQLWKVMPRWAHACVT